MTVGFLMRCFLYKLLFLHTNCLSLSVSLSLSFSLPRRPSRSFALSVIWLSHLLYFSATASCVSVLVLSFLQITYLLNIYHLTYTFSHGHTEAHTHKHTCTISTQEEWRQPGTGA